MVALPVCSPSMAFSLKKRKSLSSSGLSLSGIRCIPKNLGSAGNHGKSRQSYTEFECPAKPNPAWAWWRTRLRSAALVGLSCKVAATSTYVCLCVKTNQAQEQEVGEALFPLDQQWSNTSYSAPLTVFHPYFTPLKPIRQSRLGSNSPFTITLRRYSM